MKQQRSNEYLTQMPQNNIIDTFSYFYDVGKIVRSNVLGAWLMLMLCALISMAMHTTTIEKIKSMVIGNEDVVLSREQQMKVEPEVVKLVENYDPNVNSELYKLARYEEEKYNEFVQKSVAKMYVLPTEREYFKVFTIPKEELLKFGTVDKREQYYTYRSGRTTSVVNVRKKNSVNSKRVCTVLWNTQLSYRTVDDNWAKVLLNDGTVGYINQKYLTHKKAKSRVLDTVREHQKSYMDYRTVTARGTKAYRVSRNLAYTGNYGIRQIDGRYLCAVGTYYASENQVGKYVDLILANGTVIPCILGDTKADKDTDSTNRYTRHDHSVVEFIVDTGSLSGRVRRQGNLNYANPNWNSSIVDIRVYSKSL